MFKFNRDKFGRFKKFLRIVKRITKYKGRSSGKESCNGWSLKTKRGDRVKRWKFMFRQSVKTTLRESSERWNWEQTLIMYGLWRKYWPLNIWISHYGANILNHYETLQSVDIFTLYNVQEIMYRSNRHLVSARTQVCTWIWRWNQEV
jgi:hypothetical protein